jgi:hypothetical protein
MLSMGKIDTQGTYLRQIDEWFPELEGAIPVEVVRRVEAAKASGEGPRDRGAVWTYLTSDQPFGTWSERFVKGLLRKL